MSWGKKALGELCLIEKGKIGIQKAVPGEYPLVVTAEERLSHNEYHFEGNAVVIPLVSSTGHGHRSLKRIHFQSGKFAVGNILCAVIPHDENVLRADYLYRFLDLNIEIELVGRMKGMANVSLPIKEIARIEIPVPPIEAQIDFVKQYSTLEDKSNDMGGELTHQRDLVKQLRQAFLREAMQGKLVPQDHKEEPASMLLEKIKAEKERLVKEGKIKKQKPLPPITAAEIPFEIPENWVWCKIGDISTSIVPNRDKPKTFSGTIPWVTQSNFSEKTFKLDYSVNDIGLSLEEAKKYNCRIMPRGAIVMSCVGRFDLVCLIDKDIVANQQLHCFIPMIETMSKYLIYCIKILNEEVAKTAIHTTIKYLNKTKIESIPIPLPPLPVQQRIVAKLDQLMVYCDELEASIKASQQQNELLLQQVLREALQPKDMNL